MMTTKEIFHNPWVSTKVTTLNNGGKYVYSSEPWCDSVGIAVLPYIKRQRKGVRPISFDYAFLGRYEICPAHSLDPELCAITGGHDVKGESYRETARRELHEEAGYDLSVGKLQPLGMVRPSKASDKIVHLFAVNVTEEERGVAHGDGSAGEEGAYCFWVSKEKAIFSKDPVLATMIQRLDVLKKD